MSDEPLDRRRRATFNIYTAIPDEIGADQLEVVTTKLIEFLNSGRLYVLNITWSCPELGKQRRTIPQPVLAFRRED